MAGELKIIKASAGSGKTHTLTQQYLRLLYKREGAFRNILAVTFTNKATEEMKQRIIETLYKESLVSDKGKDALSQILNDYSSFSVTTIDSFLQRVLRAFAREIGLNSSYTVELDQELVLSEAIDSMITSLELKENRELVELLTFFGLDSIDKGDSWNIFRDLRNLGDELFRESYKVLNLPIIGQESNLNTNKLIHSLKGVEKQFEERVKALTNEFFNLLESYNLDLYNFSGKSRAPFTIFKKIAAGQLEQLSRSFLKIVSSPTPLDQLRSVTMSKTDPSLYDSIENFWYGGGAEIVNSVAELYESEWSHYVTAQIVYQNLHQTRLLGYIELFLNEFLKENNLVMIADSTILLNKIIGESDAPFIYEKVGSKFDHFLLDEFQDTSPVQWHNFTPLIEEGLSRGKESLVVGDVKQSIYRWRNSDWTLLSSGIYNDIGSERIEESGLMQNWRSSKAIVEFNNSFFSFLAEEHRHLLGDEDASIYSSAAQTIPSSVTDREGWLSISFLESDLMIGDWKEVALHKSIYQVEAWLNRGYSYSDITFLVRTNAEGERVVNALLEASIPVLSNESLFISSSPAVSSLIALLKFIQNPDNQINNAYLELQKIDSSLVIEFASLPLYQMCEQIILTIFGEVGENDSIYLSAFLNLVLQYGSGERGNLYSFLQWWEISGTKQSVATPSGMNAVKVMTIHKAKGLGIPLVILPFMQLRMNHSGLRAPLVWCHTDSPPFNSLPLVAVRYSKKMEESLFKEEYLLEKKKSYMDNLNLAYVAMTRAKEEMAIFAPLPSPNSSSSSLSNSLYKFLHHKLELTHYEAGEAITNSSNSKEVISHLKSPPLRIGVDSSKVKLALRGEEYFNEKSARGMGLIMHYIMEQIVVEEDLEKALDGAVSTGVLPLQLREEVQKKILKMFLFVRERGWFDGSYRALREVTLLLPSGGVKRPDRVLLSSNHIIVLDYKFGAKRLSSHLKSVKEYCSIIGQMKSNVNKSIKGFVWYPDNNELIECVE